MGGSAGITVSSLPTPPYSVSGLGRAWAKLSLVLQQYQETGSGIIGERIKPGAYHSLEYELEVWDGTTSSSTITLTQSSANTLIQVIDQCQQSFINIDTSTNISGSANAKAGGAWGADFRPIDDTVVVNSGSQSSTTVAEVLAGGTAQISASGDCYGGGTVTGGPILKYQASIEPRFWRQSYSGSYKILSTGGSIEDQAPPFDTGYVPGSNAHTYLHGPFSGPASFSDDQHGGFSVIQIGSSTSFVGNRAGGFTLSLVSATTTSPGSPIPHEDHPDGDLIAVREDKSDAISITHNGDRVIDNASTLAPSGGEWVKVTGPGTIAIGGSGGVRMATTSTYPSMFQRGWVVYGPPPSYLYVSGTYVDCVANRFIDIAYEAHSYTSLTVWLPHHIAMNGSYGDEGVDPRSTGGSRRWNFNLPVGTGTLRLDLCNPDPWPIKLPQLDPPYEIPATLPPSFGSPEGYSTLDRDQWRGPHSFGSIPVFVGSNTEGNYSGITSFTRMQFTIQPEGDLTVNSITLMQPDALVVDMGKSSMQLWTDGKLAAQKGLDGAWPGPTGNNFGTLLQFLDTIEGITVTSTLSPGTEPADWTSRSGWENWNGRSTSFFYWGATGTNLGITDPTTVSTACPLLGGYALPGNHSSSTAGYSATNSLILRARFGSAFSGVCLLEPYDAGTGSVEIVGVGTESISSHGVWGFPGIPCKTGSPWRAIRWTEADLEQLPLIPGINSAGRGVRRFVGFKMGPIEKSCGLFIDLDGLFPFERQFSDPFILPED